MLAAAAGSGAQTPSKESPQGLPALSAPVAPAAPAAAMPAANDEEPDHSRMDGEQAAEAVVEAGAPKSEQVAADMLDVDGDEDLGPDGWDDVLGAWIDALGISEKLAAVGVDPGSPADRAVAQDAPGDPARDEPHEEASLDVAGVSKAATPLGSGGAPVGSPSHAPTGVVAERAGPSLHAFSQYSGTAAPGQDNKLANLGAAGTAWAAPTPARHSALFGAGLDPKPTSGSLGSSDRLDAGSRSQSIPGSGGAPQERNPRGQRPYLSVLPLALQQASDSLPCLGGPGGAASALGAMRPTAADFPALLTDARRFVIGWLCIRLSLQYAIMSVFDWATTFDVCLSQACHTVVNVPVKHACNDP